MRVIIILLSMVFTYSQNPSGVLVRTQLPLQWRQVSIAHACAPCPDSIATAIGDSTASLTRKMVWRYIKSTRMLFPHIVYKQAILESGLTSQLAKNNNNLLGMRLPHLRRTTATGTRNGYAVYPTWQACIDDYHIMQQRFAGKTENEYYYFLRTYGDSNYVNNLKKAVVKLPE